MYKYVWDGETGGLLLLPEVEKMSLEPRPVYYRELDILGFDKHWKYPKDDSAPLMWAMTNKYYYRGRLVATTKGGALYTPPELEIVDAPEPDGESLRFVDVEGMIAKNAELMETLAQETIQKIYNTFVEYKKKVDIFHVSYSGGKDSEVVLDLVQKTLPHDEFIVIFGDTGMEFPDTYHAVDRTAQKCNEAGIPFYRATSHLKPPDSWRIFGPPSTTIRWCCNVHKTTPQLLTLRNITGKQNLVEMAFVGVRREESVRRSEYDYISLSTKHKGQYSCNPILDWNSFEVYLYLFSNHIPISLAYKKGNNRAGCLVCPMSGDRQDYMRECCYPDEVGQFLNIVRETNGKELPTEEDNRRYIASGGWKVRNNGRDLKGFVQRYREPDLYNLEIKNPMQDWREWIKTVGTIDLSGNICTLSYKNETFQFKILKTESGFRVTFPKELVQLNASIVKVIKQVFRKAAYCIGCKECQADCKYGSINFHEGKVFISSNCRHCLGCHKVLGGCLIFKSLDLPKGNGKMNNQSIDAYADHAPKLEWIKEFFELKDDFDENNSLGSVMQNMFKRFLRDAGLVVNNKYSKFAAKLEQIGMGQPEFWGILLVNLSHTPEIGWYVKNIEFDSEVTREYLIARLQNDGTKERGAKSISGAYKRFLNLPFGSKVGMGQPIMDKNKFKGLIRGHWTTPEPRVILYSLYKFAEACGNMHQFTLTTLLDDTIERDGVSPTRIFGLDRETMIPLLNGLSTNYPEFISASFNLGMDEISLRSEKKAEDVLDLF